MHPKGAPEWDPKGDSKGDSKGVASKRSGIRKEWDPKGVGSKRRYFDIIMSRACYTNRDILIHISKMKYSYALSSDMSWFVTPSQS